MTALIKFIIFIIYALWQLGVGLTEATKTKTKRIRFVIPNKIDFKTHNLNKFIFFRIM